MSLNKSHMDRVLLHEHPKAPYVPVPLRIPPPAWSMRAEVAMFDLAMGLHSNYPLCCVISYVLLGIAGRKQSRTRSEQYDLSNWHGGFVPCERHCAEIECGRGPRLASIEKCECRIERGPFCEVLLSWLRSIHRRTKRWSS